LFTQQRTSPRSGEEPDVKEAQRLMSIAEYWAKLADIEDGQLESTVGETTGLNDSRSMRSRLASYLSRPLSEIRRHGDGACCAKSKSICSKAAKYCAGLTCCGE
jgi:hypothetical protein